MIYITATGEFVSNKAGKFYQRIDLLIQKSIDSGVKMNGTESTSIDLDGTKGATVRGFLFASDLFALVSTFRTMQFSSGGLYVYNEKQMK